MSHIPVLINETLATLNPQEGDCAIDGTYGAGGHSAAILERIGQNGKLLAVDWNEHAVRECTDRYGGDNRVICAAGNFADLAEITRIANYPKAQVMLLDLGLSSDELEHSGRGFSFEGNEPLIMTYSDSEEPVMALLKTLSEEELARIIKTYGEERHAATIARAIVHERRKKPIETTAELRALVEKAVPRRGRLHPATKTFMALRIYANKELNNLEQAITNIPNLVAPGGRVAIISFHSLEDRIVKHRFRELKDRGRVEVLTKKPLMPQQEEKRLNPRSRSAKLRAIKLT